MVRTHISLSNVNKGTGLELLLKEIGLTFDECIAFGDGANDLEMLQNEADSIFVSILNNMGKLNINK